MPDLNLEQSVRAEDIAEAWYQALKDYGYVPTETVPVQSELLDITRQIIALSSDGQFSIERARVIGGRIARLGYKRVAVIGKAPAILSQLLTQNLKPEQVIATNARLADVLTQVIAGFLEQQYQNALEEKDQAQKQIEEDLRASEARYRSVVNTQTEIIGRTKPDGTITFVNIAASRLFGLPVEAMIGHNIAEFLPSSGLSMVDQNSQFSNLFNLGNPLIQEEVTVTRPNGDTVHLEVTTQAIFNPLGELMELQSTGRDVTDIRRIEAALRESEERYRSVVEGQTELIARFAADGTITFVNEAFCRYFGKDRKEILGSFSLDLVYSEDKDIIIKALENLQNNLSTDLNKPYQTRVLLPDGKYRWVESVTNAIYKPDGSFHEFQVVARDVTEIIQIEAELRKSNELLRQLNDQLINIQEIERQRIARELHDSVLNELGAMMIAPAENLTPGAVRENYEQLIERIRQTINGLRTPMLNYGLHAALDDLFDNLMDNPHTEGELSMEIPASLARYDSNVELHLFRIVQQACDNAIQHSQARHIRLYGVLDEQRVNLTVEDDGIGFTLRAETNLDKVLAQKHFGLVSMLERGKLIGADVQIISHPGAGTQVRVLWAPFIK